MLEPFLFLLLKHAICDLGLQRWRPARSKLNPFGPGIQLHCFDHAIGTGIVLSFFVSPELAVMMAMIDYLAHGTIDCIKSNLFKIFGIDHGSDLYWSWQTVDQMLHYITYYYILILIEIIYLT